MGNAVPTHSASVCASPQTSLVYTVNVLPGPCVGTPSARADGAGGEVGMCWCTRGFGAAEPWKAGFPWSKTGIPGVC